MYDNKLLGILITVYNSSSVIEALLKNIYALENFDESWINIYILDDASKDDTIDVLEKLRNKYNFKIIKNSTNMGILYSRDKLTKIADEEFILFVDDDDALSKNVLTDFKNNYKSHDLLILQRKFVYEQKEVVHTEWYRLRENKIQTFFIYTHGFFLTGIFIKKNLYKNSNIFFLNTKGINYYEDIPIYMMLIFFSTNPCFLNTYYLYNRKNNKSLLSTNNPDIKFKFTKMHLINVNEKIKGLDIFRNADFENLLAIVNIRLLYYLYSTSDKNTNKDLKTMIKTYLPKKNKIILNKGDKLNYILLKWNPYSKIYRWVINLRLYRWLRSHL